MEVFFSFHITYILFYIITLLWILEFVFFPSKHKDKDFSERKSFKMILISIVSSIGLTIILTFANYTVLESQVFRYIGISFYLLGLVLRYVSTLYLGKYFTRDVSVEKTQSLVSNGPYKILRHPLYLGLFLLTISVPLFFGNIIAFFYSNIIMGYVLNHRMKIEEMNMELLLNDTYRNWKKDRYRFIPFIY